MRRFAPVAAALALAALPAAAEAAPSSVKVGDFSEPVHVSGPPNDASRVFVVEQGGRVKVVVNGQTAAAPFLDLTEATLTDGGGERGLLSIAFAPDYASSGRFYVFVTARGSAWGEGVGDGDILVLEGRRSAQNPNVAETATPRIVADVDHSASNHNGGQLAFGPDGALYASIGDNASGANAQSGGNLFGKILRFADPRTGAAPDIWARGLRNPWRFSFDRVTGEVWIGDVGESTWEEIDRVPFTSAGGHNFGWPTCEGVCNRSGLADPVRALPTSGYSAVIGGVVVRHPGLPSLAGRYVFSGLQRPSVESVDLAGGSFRAESGVSTAGPRSFGEDGCGRVYVATADAVSRITETASAACVPSFGGQGPPGGGQPSPGPAPGGDTTKPVVRVKKGKRRVGAFVIRLRSAEDARATVKARGYRTRRVRLAAGVSRAVKVKAKRATVRRLRDRRRVVRTVRIRVVDAAGNATVKTPRIRLR